MSIVKYIFSRPQRKTTFSRPMLGSSLEVCTQGQPGLLFKAATTEIWLYYLINWHVVNRAPHSLFVLDLIFFKLTHSFNLNLRFPLFPLPANCSSLTTSLSSDRGGCSGLSLICLRRHIEDEAEKRSRSDVTETISGDADPDVHVIVAHMPTQWSKQETAKFSKLYRKIFKKFLTC